MDKMRNRIERETARKSDAKGTTKNTMCSVSETLSVYLSTTNTRMNPLRNITYLPAAVSFSFGS